MNYPAHQFSAQLSSLNEVLSHVAKICIQAGLEKNARLQVELVIEELFTNTVQHGYDRDCQHSVWIAADISHQNLCITYQDAAPPYNPLTSHVNHKDLSTVGGQGITLIKSFAHVSYLYENGLNTLVLIFQLSD